MGVQHPSKGFTLGHGSPLDPAKKPKASGRDEDDEDDDKPQEALVGAAPRKSLPGPKDKKEKGSGSSRGGSVPSVPRNKKGE